MKIETLQKIVKTLNQYNINNTCIVTNTFTNKSYIQISYLFQQVFETMTLKHVYIDYNNFANSRFDIIYKGNTKWKNVKIKEMFNLLNKYKIRYYKDENGRLIKELVRRKDV